MAFKFSLQNVLEWREDLEEEAKQLLVEVKNIHKNEDEILQKLIHEHIQIKEKATLFSSIDVMRQNDLYKKVLTDKIIQQKLIVEQSLNDIQLAENKLIKSYQDKKVIEKLKEKEYEKYVEKINLEEQKVLDEFATITFGRSQY